MPLSRSYDLHGLRLSVETMAKEISDEVDALLLPFTSTFKKEPDFLISISSDYSEERESLPSSGIFWDGDLPDGTHLTCGGDEIKRWIKLHGLSLARFDVRSRRAEIFLGPGAEWCLISGNLIPVLAEFLREADHHLIHAATLVMDSRSNRAIVISGASGRGKTTAALALVNSGMKLLSDDISFVTGVDIDPISPRMWGLMPRLKVCRPTLQLMPWITLLWPPKFEGNHEVYFDPGIVRRTGACSTARPDVIIFLAERNMEDHLIKPLDRIAALSSLAKENISAVDRKGKGPSGKSFKAIASLVGKCKCFTLSASPHLETLRESLSPFLEE